MTTTALTFPTVHLNGTSRDALAEQLTEAENAVRAAMRALEAAAPNARDYYPQGTDAYTRAAREHAARTSKLLTVLNDLQLMVDHVCNS